MKVDLPEEEILLRRRNRIRKLTPKTHRIVHEFGRSTKSLWREITTKAYGIKKSKRK